MGFLLQKNKLYCNIVKEKAVTKGGRVMQHIDENAMNTKLRELKPFINEEGQLTSYPAKYKKKLMALWYLADKIDMDREYSEPEINSLINSLHTFGDQATLRRELINKRLLFRSTDCSRYWAEENDDTFEAFMQRFI